MADMSHKATPRDSDEEGQVPLDLVPSFAAEENGEGDSWSPLTTTNAEYERLWSVPATFEATNGTPSEEVESTSPEEPETPPPVLPEPAEPEPAVATPGFTGTLVTGNEVLNASIVVGSERIMLWGGGSQIGNWLHSEARVARLTHARFAIQAEGETLTFTAEDPTGLDDAIALAVKTPEPGPEPTEAPASTTPIAPASQPAARRLSTKSAGVSDRAADASPPSTLAAEPAPVPAVPEDPPPAQTTRRPRIKNFRPEASDTLPPILPDPSPGFADEPSTNTDEDPDFTIADTIRARSDVRTVKPRRFLPNDMRGIGIKAAMVLGLVLFLGGVAYAVMLLMGRVGGEEDSDSPQPVSTAPPVTIVITTAPPPTVATTAPLPDTTLFQTDPSILTERWNTLAEVTAPNMMLFSDITTPFILLLTPNVTMEGVLDPAAGNVTLRGTPTGTPEGDGAILSALGILIGTADPTLDGGDRKALLGQLGLDVDRPELGGINGSLTHNGLLYRLVYQAEANSLEFVITPEGATTTTAAG